MTPVSETSERTRWHCLLGRVLAEPLTRLGVTVQTEVDVTGGSPKADIILLRREGDDWTEEQKSWLADGLRDTPARELLIEFKFAESVNEEAIAQLFVNDTLYRARQRTRPEELSSFLLAARTPRAELMQAHGFKAIGQPGVYATEYPQFSRLRVIVLNELADWPHNAPLKSFASREIEWRKGIEQMIGRGLNLISIDFEWFFSGIRRLRMKGMAEALMEQMEPVGWTPETVLELGRLAWFEEMMEHLPEERLLQFRRAADIRDRGREEGREEGEARMILRQLSRRFGPLPAFIQERVVRADERSLELWGDRLLDARSLDEVFADDSPPMSH